MNRIASDVKDKIEKENSDLDQSPMMKTHEK